MAAGDRRTGQRDADGPLMAALASGATGDEAGRQANISTRTVYRRLDDPAFRTLIDAAREELISTATAKLIAVAGTAVETSPLS